MSGDNVRKAIRTIGQCAAAAAVIIAVALPRVFASSEIPVMQASVSGDSVEMYLSGVGAGQKAQAQIGTESLGEVTLRELDSSSPIVTWVLIDNSLSISNADREKTKKLVTDIAAGRAANERLTLCTISDHLHILSRESKDYAQLKGQIDAIKYENQETYLTDVLDEVLNDEASREEDAYVRFVVISDGVDNNPGGITRDELMKRLAGKNYPIYSIGCKGEDSALKAMYAFSRETRAKSWAMSEISDTLAITSALSGAEVPVRVDVAIPETLQDGTIKGVQLSFEGGATAETQVTMPFGTVTSPPEPEPEPEPAPAPEPEPEPEPEKNNLPLILGGVAVVALLAAVGGAVFFFLRRQKKKEQFQPVGDDERGVTELLDGEPQDSDGGTLILVGENRSFMLSLTDVNHPEHHFEAPLRNKVTIGRGRSNQIVVDYDRSVSNNHCEILVSSNMLKIHDRNSRNGTFVDNTQVVDTTEIKNGSTIRLGRVLFRVGIQ